MDRSRISKWEVVLSAPDRVNLLTKAGVMHEAGYDISTSCPLHMI